MAFSTPSLACWDDDDDDWYDYYYDWLDDDSSLYGDYDPNGYWLDEVEVTYKQPYDWGLDDDWWRTDDEAFDDYDGDNDDNDDYYDNNNDDNYYENHNVGYGNEDEENQDKTATPPPYFKQECNLCCVPAVMAIINMVMDGLTLKEAQAKYNEYVDKYREWSGKDVSIDGIPSDQIRKFFRECDFITSPCTIDRIEECVNRGMNVFVYIDVIGDDNNPYGHALDIISTDKDKNGDTIYTCVNPNTGEEECHKRSDFTHPTTIFAVRETNIKRNDNE